MVTVGVVFSWWRVVLCSCQTYGQNVGSNDCKNTPEISHTRGKCVLAWWNQTKFFFQLSYTVEVIGHTNGGKTFEMIAVRFIFYLNTRKSWHLNKGCVDFLYPLYIEYIYCTGSHVTRAISDHVSSQSMIQIISVIVRVISDSCSVLGMFWTWRASDSESPVDSQPRINLDKARHSRECWCNAHASYLLENIFFVFFCWKGRFPLELLTPTCDHGFGLPCENPSVCPHPFAVFMQYSTTSLETIRLERDSKATAGKKYTQGVMKSTFTHNLTNQLCTSTITLMRLHPVDFKRQGIPISLRTVTKAPPLLLFSFGFVLFCHFGSSGGQCSARRLSTA